MCDALTNTCKADQTAKHTCAAAAAAANATTAKSGAQADAFNTVFGIQTNFAAVQEIDDTGKPIARTWSATSGSSAGIGSSTAAQIDASATASAAYITVGPSFPFSTHYIRARPQQVGTFAKMATFAWDKKPYFPGNSVWLTNLMK